MAEHAQVGQERQGGTKGGTAGNAERVRVGKGVEENPLIDNSGKSQTSAYQSGGENPRQPDIHDDIGDGCFHTGGQGRIAEYPCSDDPKDLSRSDLHIAHPGRYNYHENGTEKQGGDKQVIFFFRMAIHYCLIPESLSKKENGKHF